MKVFPSGKDINKDTDHEFPIEFGMDLRQWYAGLALQGIMANSNDSFRKIMLEDAENNNEVWVEVAAMISVCAADALIKKLEESS